MNSVIAKIASAFTVTFILILTITFFYHRSNTEYTNASTNVSKSQEKLYKLARIVAMIQEVEINHNNFIIIQEEGYLEKVITYQEPLEKELSHLQLLLEKDDLYSAFYSVISPIISDYINERTASIQLIKDGNIGNAEKIIKSGQGKQHLEDLKKYVNLLSEFEYGRFVDLQEMLKEKSGRNFKFLIVFTILVFTITVGLFYLVINGLIANKNLGLKLTSTNTLLKSANAEISSINKELISKNLMLIQSNEKIIDSNRKLIDVNEKLIDSENEYRNLIEGANDLIFKIDSEGNFILCNHVVETITGYKISELYSKSFFDLLKREEVEKFRLLVTAQIQLKNQFCYLEVPFKPKSGHLIWLGLKIGFKFQKDELKEMLIIARDITSSKFYEDELVTAKESAESSLKIKEQFLNIISHEIRTPLNAVLGMCNLLLLENPKPDQIENLNVLNISANHLLSLVNDILDFSKIEAGKVEFENTNFSLNALLSDLNDTLSIKAREKNLTFNINIEQNVPDEIIADASKLRQVLNYISGNSLKFTESGSISIRVGFKATSNTEGELLFEIKDSGIGIALDKQQMIFEIFTQANNEYTRKYGGTGLGLAISKKLIESQGGEINVISKEGVGSTFTFNLKVGYSDNSFYSQEINNYNLGQGLKILVVEDNVVNQYIAQKFLENWGMSVEFADNGKIGFEMVKENHYDLILMDLQMPVMDGFEATKRIRILKDQNMANVPIIAVTASTLYELKDSIMKCGMNAYVPKPFDPDDLYKKIINLTIKQHAK
jgi:PAS domain S-box-containing protein